MSKKRVQKISKGIHGGGGKTRLSRLQKYLIAGGGPALTTERKLRSSTAKTAVATAKAAR